MVAKLKRRVPNFQRPPVKPVAIKPTQVNINNNSFQQTNNNSFKKTVKINNSRSTFKTTNIKTRINARATIGITLGAASAAALYNKTRKEKK
jgi:hypothetical protein